MHVDVHYYEDGNVRLTATKELSNLNSASTAPEALRQIALAEKSYQTELNRGLAGLSEGAFKGLRRQLPVTRQKVRCLFPVSTHALIAGSIGKPNRRRVRQMADDCWRRSTGTRLGATGLDRTLAVPEGKG